MRNRLYILRYWQFSFIGFFLIYCLQLSAQEFVPNTHIQFKSLSTKEGLTQSTVFSITQDKNGFIWIGTRDGLNRYDGYDYTYYKHSPFDTNTLSNNEITSIYVDFDGDVWVGTQGGGVNHFIYNENRFIRYNKLNYENVVRKIFQTRDSTLWVGTSEGLLKSKTDHDRYNFNNVSKNSIYYNQDHQIIPLDHTLATTVAMVEMNKDKMLVGTNKGVYVFVQSDNKFQQVFLGDLTEEYITSIVKESDLVYWISSFKGLIKLQFQTDEHLQSDFKIWSMSQDGKYNIGADRIESVVIDNEGNKWFGTRGRGIYKMDKNERLNNYIYSTEKKGALSDNIINSLFIDQKQVLWVGTESKGCNLLELRENKFYTIGNLYEESINNQSSGLVTAITGSDNQGIWIGSPVNGLSNIKVGEKGYNRFSQIQELPVNSDGLVSDILSLLYSKDKDLWIGTASNDLIKYSKDGRFTNILVNGFVFALYRDKQENMWFGTWGQGLGRVNEEGSEIFTLSNQNGKEHALSSDKVFSIIDDNEGNLWVGTKGGGINVAPIEVLKRNENYFIVFRNEVSNTKSLSHNDIYCIYQDRSGIVWIGTGGGLNKVMVPEGLSLTDAVLKRKITFKSYLERHGLPSSMVYGILEDDKGRLWLSTINGLSMFDKEKEVFVNYNESDGLYENEFYYNAFYKDPEGVFYFGGVNGLTYFHPDSIVPSGKKSKVSLTGIRIFNREVNPGDLLNGEVLLKKVLNDTEEVKLSYKNKEITIDFSAMQFANADAINYQYRLLNFNDNWQETGEGENSATYTNLDGGEYIFQVKRTGTSPNQEMALLKIIISPPFWKRPFFYIIYFVLIMLLLIIFRRYSIIGAKEKNKLIIEHLENQKQHEISEAKMKFFTNISHEIRTPLTLINDPLEQVLKHESLDEKVHKDLKLVSRNVKRLINLANQLLQFRKIDLGIIQLKKQPIRLDVFLDEIKGFFEQQAEKKNIEIRYNKWKDPLLVDVDKEMMVTVFYNLLSNAVKYSPDGSVINITVEINNIDTKPIKRAGHKLGLKNPANQVVTIAISDQGPGITSKDLINIFRRFYQAGSSNSRFSGSGIGLALVKEFVELHNGNVNVESEEGKGSTFTVLLPYISTLQASNSFNRPHFGLQKIINWHIADGGENLDIIKSESLAEHVEHNKKPMVLLIEDDQEMAQYLFDNLKTTFHIKVVSNGKEGLEKAESEMPDLVVSDVMLPEINGFDICKSLKNNIETSHIPIILLSARSADENIIEGYDYGADLYMTKPFSMPVLQSQINALLASRKKLRNLFSKQMVVGPKEVAVASVDQKFIKQLNKIIEKNLNKSDFDVSSLVSEMHMSHATILRKVKALTDLSLVDYLKNYRLQKACLIFQQEKVPINEVCYMVGFSDPKYFSKCFQKEFEMSPSEYVKTHHP